MLQAASQVVHFFMVGGVIEGYESWEEAIDRQPAEPIADQSNGVPMLYSSGTTGQPKGVFVPPEGDDVDTPPILAQSLGLAFGFGEETVYLSPAPLYHAAPLHYNMMNLYQGGTSVIMERSFLAENAAITRLRCGFLLLSIGLSRSMAGRKKII